MNDNGDNDVADATKQSLAWLCQQSFRPTQYRYRQELVVYNKQGRSRKRRRCVTGTTSTASITNQREEKVSEQEQLLQGLGKVVDNQQNEGEEEFCWEYSFRQQVTKPASFCQLQQEAEDEQDLEFCWESATKSFSSYSHFQLQMERESRAASTTTMADPTTTIASLDPTTMAVIALIGLMVTLGFYVTQPTKSIRPSNSSGSSSSIYRGHPTDCEDASACRGSPSPPVRVISLTSLSLMDHSRHSVHSSSMRMSMRSTQQYGTKEEEEDDDDGNVPDDDNDDDLSSMEGDTIGSDNANNLCEEEQSEPEELVSTTINSRGTSTSESQQEPGNVHHARDPLPSTRAASLIAGAVSGKSLFASALLAISNDDDHGDDENDDEDYDGTDVSSAHNTSKVDAAVTTTPIPLLAGTMGNGHNEDSNAAAAVNTPHNKHDVMAQPTAGAIRGKVLRLGEDDESMDSHGNHPSHHSGSSSSSSSSVSTLSTFQPPKTTDSADIVSVSSEMYESDDDDDDDDEDEDEDEDQDENEDDGNEGTKRVRCLEPSASISSSSIVSGSGSILRLEEEHLHESKSMNDVSHAKDNDEKSVPCITWNRLVSISKSKVEEGPYERGQALHRNDKTPASKASAERTSSLSQAHSENAPSLPVIPSKSPLQGTDKKEKLKAELSFAVMTAEAVAASVVPIQGLSQETETPEATESSPTPGTKAADEASVVQEIANAQESEASIDATAVLVSPAKDSPQLSTSLYERVQPETEELTSSEQAESAAPFNTDLPAQDSSPLYLPFQEEPNAEAPHVSDDAVTSSPLAASTSPYVPVSPANDAPQVCTSLLEQAQPETEELASSEQAEPAAPVTVSTAKDSLNLPVTSREGPKEGPKAETLAALEDALISSPYAESTTPFVSTSTDTHQWSNTFQDKALTESLLKQAPSPEAFALSKITKCMGEKQGASMTDRSSNDESNTLLPETGEQVAVEVYKASCIDKDNGGRCSAVSSEMTVVWIRNVSKIVPGSRSCDIIAELHDGQLDSDSKSSVGNSFEMEIICARPSARHHPTTKSNESSDESKCGEDYNSPVAVSTSSSFEMEVSWVRNNIRQHARAKSQQSSNGGCSSSTLNCGWGDKHHNSKDSHKTGVLDSPLALSEDLSSAAAFLTTVPSSASAARSEPRERAITSLDSTDTDTVMNATCLEESQEATATDKLDGLRDAANATTSHDITETSPLVDSTCVADSGERTTFGQRYDLQDFVADSKDTHEVASANEHANIFQIKRQLSADREQPDLSIVETTSNLLMRRSSTRSDHVDVEYPGYELLGRMSFDSSHIFEDDDKEDHPVLEKGFFPTRNIPDAVTEGRGSDTVDTAEPSDSLPSATDHVAPSMAIDHRDSAQEQVLGGNSTKSSAAELPTPGTPERMEWQGTSSALQYDTPCAEAREGTAEPSPTCVSALFLPDNDKLDKDSHHHGSGNTDTEQLEYPDFEDDSEDDEPYEHGYCSSRNPLLPPTIHRTRWNDALMKNVAASYGLLGFQDEDSEEEEDDEILLFGEDSCPSSPKTTKGPKPTMAQKRPKEGLHFALDPVRPEMAKSHRCILRRARLLVRVILGTNDRFGMEYKTTSACFAALDRIASFRTNLEQAIQDVSTVDEFLREVSTAWAKVWQCTDGSRARLTFPGLTTSGGDDFDDPYVAIVTLLEKIFKLLHPDRVMATRNDCFKIFSKFSKSVSKQTTPFHLEAVGGVPVSFALKPVEGDPSKRLRMTPYRCDRHLPLALQDALRVVRCILGPEHKRVSRNDCLRAIQIYSLMQVQFKTLCCHLRKQRKTMTELCKELGFLHKLVEATSLLPDSVNFTACLLNSVNNRRASSKVDESRRRTSKLAYFVGSLRKSVHDRGASSRVQDPVEETIISFVDYISHLLRHWDKATQKP